MFIIVVDVRVACVAGVVAGITCAMCETAVFRASERGVAERVRWSSGPLRATHLTRGGGGVLCGGPSPGAVRDDADGAWAFGVGAWRRRCQWPEGRVDASQWPPRRFPARVVAVGCACVADAKVGECQISW